MTVDLTLPASLLAPQPRGRVCPRCGKRAFPHLDRDYIDCLHCGEVFVGMALDIPQVGHGAHMKIGQRQADRGIER